MGPEVVPAPPLRLTEARVPDDVDLVVLFGPRARGNAHASSDWDVGVRFHRPQQPLLHLCALDPVLARAIGCSSDAIDLVELDQVSYLLQRCVAEDGIALFERQPGLFTSFCSRAIRQWADWQRRQQKLAQERAVPLP